MVGLVSAIGRSLGVFLSARNTNHFTDLGIDLIYPFESYT